MNIFKKKKEVINLEKIYNENREVFEHLLIKDFVGYIPDNVQEPVLKCFKEYGEAFEKWCLWQSWYINTRAMNDPLKIPLYNGMMVYLKVLHTLGKTNKKNYQPPIPQNKDEVVVPSFIDSALEGLNYFKDNVNKTKSVEDYKSTEDNEDAKV